MQAAGSTTQVATRCGIALLLGLAACRRGADPTPAASSAPSSPSQHTLLPSPTGLVRWTMSEEEVQSTFHPEPNLQYDPLTYWRRRSHLDYSLKYAEYPGGAFRVRTNADGMRESAEVLMHKPELRILVAGDSHTDCVCDNHSSYPNQLEAMLAARRSDRVVEVLNCGVGSYSFYNYLGVLEKYSRLEPDVFVVGVFGGNDFGEVLVPWYHFLGRVRPGSPAYRLRLEQALAVEVRGGNTAYAVAQGYNQYFYFDCEPAQLDVALGAATAVMDEIESLCTARNIKLVVLYIPPPAEVEYEPSRELYQAMSQAFGMSPRMPATIASLGDRFLAHLRERGVSVLDGRQIYAQHGGPFYWREDLHINLAANRVLAEALVPLVDGKRQ